MSKKKRRYYVVVKGRKIGIYTNWNDCKTQVHKYSNAKYKSFNNLEDAKSYYSKFHKELSTLVIDRIDDLINVDNCIICGKPFIQKLAKKGKRKNSPFCPACYNTSTKKEYCKKLKKKKINAINILNKQRENYKKDSNIKGVPPYIYKCFGKDKEIVSVKGNMKNPLITYCCKRCGKNFSVKWFRYKKKQGHDCKALISTGEAIVEDYLKKHNIPYKTQRNTLKCVNPETKHIMPYDFELIGKKAIIEVQGEQHRQFTPRFHIDNEGFEYQQKKDKYKKEYAISKGYTYIEIWYDEFDNGKYIEKIENVI